MEHETRVGGVVVSDKDNGALGARVPHLGDDVVRGARRQQTPKPKPTAADIVVDGRRGEAAAHRPKGTPAGRRGGERAGVQQPERPPVAPVRALGLHAHVARAGPLELVRQPLGRAPLARARGGPLEGGELTDDPLDEGTAVGQTAGQLSGRA